MLDGLDSPLSSLEGAYLPFVHPAFAGRFRSTNLPNSLEIDPVKSNHSWVAHFC